jgi:hypothetical protein
MEIASDCDPSFSPRRRDSVSHPGLFGRLGGGGGNVCLPPSLVNGPGDSGRPVSARIRGPHSGGLPWCRVRVGARGAAPLGRPLPPSAAGLRGRFAFLLRGAMPCIDILRN